MGYITGVRAAISGIPCVEKFQILTHGFDTAVACSDSGGAVVRSTSNKDWKGLAVGFGHTPPYLPGAKFTFTGSDRAGQGWRSAANGAIVDKVQIFGRSEQNRLFFYHLYFSASGSLTPGAYQATYGSTPSPVSSVGRGIAINTVAVSGIGWWELELEGNNAAPIWPADGGGWPVRDAGNVDATVSYQQRFNTYTDIPTLVDSFDIYRLYVTASTYWEIKWAQVLQEPVEYVVSDEQNRPKYVAVEPKAHWSSAYGGAAGHIQKPNGAFYWPV